MTIQFTHAIRAGMEAWFLGAAFAGGLISGAVVDLFRRGKKQTTITKTTGELIIGPREGTYRERDYFELTIEVPKDSGKKKIYRVQTVQELPESVREMVLNQFMGQYRWFYNLMNGGHPQDELPEGNPKMNVPNTPLSNMDGTRSIWGSRKV